MSKKVRARIPSTVIILMLVCDMVLSQTPLGIGEWQSFPGNGNYREVVQSEKSVFFRIPNALIQVDKQSLSYEIIAKEDGLTDANPRTIAYSTFEDLLVVAYEDSRIDLVYENEVISISEIKNNTNITGSRLINDIHIESRQHLYLACDFGLVEYNLERQEFGFTSFSDISLKGCSIFKDYIFASSEDGIYRAPLDGSINLADFSQYELLGAAQGLPPVYSSSDLVNYDGALYAIIDDVVYRAESLNEFSLFFEKENFFVSYVNEDSEELVLGMRCRSGCPHRVYFVDGDGQEIRHGSECVGSPRQALTDQYGTRWYADSWGDIRYQLAGESSCKKLKTNLPISSNLYEVNVVEDNVYVSAGGATRIFNFVNSRNGWYQLDSEREWTNINQFNNEEYNDLDILDILYVREDPRDPETLYLVSNGSGVIKYNESSGFEVFDNTNSPLRGTSGTVNQERVTGAAWDREGNLWVSNYLTQESLKVLKRDQTWQTYTLPSNLTTKIEVDRSQNKWIIDNSQTSGFIVFHEGDTAVSGDESIKLFSPANSELESNTVLDIVEDREGELWVGTDQGVVSFNCPDPFSSNCRGFRQIVDEGGFGGFLLSRERVQTIGIDGGNRKWFGTQNGVFVQSPNGEEQIAHFTQENSPLPSDNILSIDINQQNGEVFIGTDQGLVVYRSDATAGGNTHREDLKVFPNPVRPEYTGPIAIEGLAQDALVKITDVSGNIVSEILANGGQAIWNGRDLDGNEVASGVYLVYSSTLTTFTTPDKAATKILVIR